jgi:hypothetical protein
MLSGMEVLIGVFVLVVAMLVIGGAPMVRRTAHARELEMRARMPRGMDVDVDRQFDRPRDEGNLL